MIKSSFRRSIWPKVAPRFTAAALSGHSAAGLAFGALIYLICLSGTMSVLVDEMKLFEQPAFVGGALRPGALNRAVASALKQAPATTTLYATPPPTPSQRLTITTYGGAEHAFLASKDGDTTPAKTPFTDFVTDLHMTLTAPAPWGSLIVGLGGTALLSLILSGVLSHPRVFRDAFRLRLGGSERLREAELHNRLSVWGLPFHVAVTLTGAVFGLGNLVVLFIAALGFNGNAGRVYAPISGPAVSADPRPVPMPDLEALARRAIHEFAGSRIGFIGLERTGTATTRITVEVAAPTRLPRGEDVYFDARGRQIGRGRFVTGALGMQAYSGAAQLHFGFFGGLPVKLVYVVLGAALTFISASGVTIWLARRRDRGRSSPRLRRAWLAWTWGVPLSFALAALFSRHLSPVIAFWASAALFQVAAQIFASARTACTARRSRRAQASPRASSQF